MSSALLSVKLVVCSLLQATLSIKFRLLSSSGVVTESVERGHRVPEIGSLVPGSRQTNDLSKLLLVAS